MDSRIIPYQSEDFAEINELFPADWNFDFNEFLTFHWQRNYFHGFSLKYDKQTIGYGNLMVFGSICWIGNIVVSEEYRKRGFGTEITRYLIKSGKSMGARTFNLVSTKLGESLYYKLGFVTEFNYNFLVPKGTSSPDKVSECVRKANLSDLNLISALDTMVTMENREEMLQFLLSGIYLFVKQGQLLGFYIRNLGDGLIVAVVPEAGIELLKFKLEFGNKRAVVPEMNKPALDFLTSKGFHKTMHLPRMTLGERISWKPESIFNRGTGFSG